jgi:hypothetical protein
MSLLKLKPILQKYPFCKNRHLGALEGPGLISTFRAQRHSQTYLPPHLDIKSSANPLSCPHSPSAHTTGAACPPRVASSHAVTSTLRLSLDDDRPASLPPTMPPVKTALPLWQRPRLVLPLHRTRRPHQCSNIPSVSSIEMAISPPRPTDQKGVARANNERVGRDDLHALIVGVTIISVPPYSPVRRGVTITAVPSS